VVLKVVANSDIILQVLDARFVKEMRNAELEKLIKSAKKKIIYVLNKSDLVNVAKVKSDARELKPYALISCRKRTGIKDLRDLIKREAEKIKKDGFEKNSVGVIGYPNTGKSSMINLLIGKKSAGTGAVAGFTKGLQKLRLTKDIHLIDSPGVIPIDEYSTTMQKTMNQHGKLGARSYDKIKDPEIVVADLMKKFPKPLEKFYKVKAGGNSEILIEDVGRKKNFLKKGNEVDVDKTARAILKDWQEGKIVI